MSEPKKVNLESKNITEETLEELKRLVPSAFKEGKIDFDSLKAVLGDVVEPSREFYNFTWAGKSEAFRTLQRPSTATLRPCEDESKEWEKTENLFIEGDNLEVLKLLQKTYHNSIKMIYIDPPYNKDKDFVYPDRWSEGIKSYKEFCGFVDSEGNITTSEDEAKNAAGRKHSRWLTMMYPRLFLARNLLREDGVIFVSIDDDEAANLKKMMDEIFGEENFVAIFPWRKRTAKSDVPFGVSQDYEWIVCYAKEKFLAGISHERKYYRTDDFPNDGWRLSDLTTQRSAEERPNSAFNMIDPKTGKSYPFNPKRTWGVSQDTFQDYYDKGKIVFPDDYDFLNISIPAYRVFESEDKAKALKKYGSEEAIKAVSTDFPKNIGMSEDGNKEMVELFGAKIFSFPKPSTLIRYFMEVSTSKDDIILDFFAGSGTTAHAVMALNAEDGGNRKFICVQIPEPTPENSEAKKAGYKTIAEISKERIRRAGEKVKADNPLFTGDIGFKVFKLDESNFKQWDKEVADTETLRQQIMDFADNVSPEASKRDMLYELLLKKGYSLNAKVESRKIADNEIFVVDGSMLICLDDKISTTTIDEVIKLRPAHFIVLDRAFEGNDQLKVNTWQTFKTLFPNDENPFETV